MSHVSEKVRPYFENLSIDLKNEILKRNVEINTLLDLIKCLETIVDEGGSKRRSLAQPSESGRKAVRIGWEGLLLADGAFFKTEVVLPPSGVKIVL